MRKYSFAYGAKRDTTHWTQKEPLDWERFVEWLDLENPGPKKQCGGYVGGLLQETTGHLKDPQCVGLHRNKDAVVSRSMVALDADKATASFFTDTAMVLDGFVAYTTWSHTSDEPRWRLVIPLSRDVKPSEYRLIAKALMDELGEEQFDLGSSEPERLMYLPSTQGGEYYGESVSGSTLDADTWLFKGVELELDKPAIVETRHYQGDATYDELTFDQKMLADLSVERHVEHWKSVWAEAVTWPEEHYPNGAGWEQLATDSAWAFSRMAVCPWTSLDEVSAELLYLDTIPEEVVEALVEDDNWPKYSSGVLAKASRDPAGAPPWEIEDFDVWHVEKPNLLEGLNDYDPSDISSDLQLGKRVAREYLLGRYLAWGKTAWAMWDGKRWDIGVSGDVVNGDVREALLHIRREEIGRADRKRDKDLAKASGNTDREKQAIDAHTNRMREVKRLSKAETLNNARRLARPDLVVDLEEFDGPETADLLNCGNGVVDLKTGELASHDPGLKFTKITPVDYVPGARHKDWDKCLSALPADVVPWVRRKFGQASTGHAPTDEVVLFLRGGGENGKTTFLLGIRQALGGYYTTVPDKVLQKSPGDHSAEFMPLKGARLAVIEELPGGDWLTGTNIKKAEGSETGIMARPMGQMNVSWIPTHALVATTNHLLHITDTDHGTRRRLCDLNFPFRFSGEDRDSSLKQRMKEGYQGQHEAVLAWLVAGAVETYEEPLEREHMPVTVQADTDAWLVKTNPAEEFLAMAVVHDPQSSVLSSELYGAYRDWALSNGRRALSDQSFWERASKASIFSLDEVEKTTTREYGDLRTKDGIEPVGPKRVVTCVQWSTEYLEKILGLA